MVQALCFANVSGLFDVKVGGKLVVVFPSEIINGTCRFVWPLKLSYPIC